MTTVTLAHVPRVNNCVLVVHAAQILVHYLMIHELSQYYCRLLSTNGSRVLRPTVDDCSYIISSASEQWDANSRRIMAGQSAVYSPKLIIYMYFQFFFNLLCPKMMQIMATVGLWQYIAMVY